jgi:hypothetical protein
VPTTNHSAEGPSAGFSYQFERALWWLAQCDSGFRVGIETDDDVAVRGPSGEQILEQDKHSIREKAQPFGNRSQDLWKTISIWLDALESGEATAATARFFMVTNQVLGDCIAKRISSAKTSEKVDECIEELEKAAESPPKGIATFTQRVLHLNSRKALHALISNCELIDGSQKSAGKQLRDDFVAKLPLPRWAVESADSTVNELLGWVHTIAKNNWKEGKPAWIDRDSFINQLYAVLDRKKRQIKRERSEHLVEVSDEQVGAQRGSVFVRQLHLILSDEDDDHVTEDVRTIFAAAKRVGQSFAEMTAVQLATQLNIRF